ncbi:hypothetical protein SpAn4DRAFT_3289 [Sporomusa ovata]|uniref:Uncharacterized protein n=1 Tax=Sporomusa ovata TaxID=2378 RepID=A0A0U1L0G9_9FIRM|nr:hypothetical protein SpAn4DRAFT_3289 [Sporomusa ovata]
MAMAKLPVGVGVDGLPMATGYCRTGLLPSNKVIWRWDLTRRIFARGSMWLALIGETGSTSSVVAVRF